MASTNRDEISRLELLHAAHPDGLVFPHLADAYRRAGRYAQAESVLNAGLRRHSDYSSAHVVLGRLRLDQGKHRQAEDAFQKVLQLDPQNHVALEFLGQLAEEEGRNEEALRYLRKLARIKPSEEVAEQVVALERKVHEARAASARQQSEPQTGARSNGGEADRRDRTGADGGVSGDGASGDGTDGASAAAAQPSAESGPAAAPSSPALPEPGEVVTETMAELYTRQGLHERAEAVYRRLHERDPGNARLETKLNEVIRRRKGEPPAEEPPSREPWAEPDATGAPDTPDAADAAGSAEPASVDAAGPERPEARTPTRAGGAAPTLADDVEAVSRRREPEPEEPEPELSIGEYMAGLLDWATESEPATEPTAVEPRAEPEPSPEIEGRAQSETEAGPPAPRPEAPSRESDEAAGFRAVGAAPDREPWAESPVSGPEPAGAEDTEDSPDTGARKAREPWRVAPVSEADSETPTAPGPEAGREETTESEDRGPLPEAEPSAAEPVGIGNAAGAGVEAPPSEPPTGTGTAGTAPPDASPAAPGAVDHEAPSPTEPPGDVPGTGPAPSSWPGVTVDDLGLEEDALEGATTQTRALIALADLLVGLLEFRDPFFRGSSSLTRLLAVNVAREMGLDEDDRVNLALAAVLRDLGRLALGGKLVESPKTSHTPEGRRKIERHVDLALHLLEGIDLPRGVRLAVRHHHERWDGAGYPDGLAGEEIPLLARVLAAVDSFTAMVSPRPYRLPRKVPVAAAEMREVAGTQYDPSVVDALLRVLERRDQPRLGFVQRHHILLMTPDQPGAVVTAAKLGSAGYLAEVAVDSGTARERLRRVPVSALVVSAEAGAEEAEELIRDLRLDPLFASLPIVVVDAESVALRVRMLETGADVCFPPGISHGELQGTLGALVRRTLRSTERHSADDDEAPWLALQGDIQDFPLAWLLQVMKYDSRTAAVGLRTHAEQGAIYLEKGDAVHAQIRGGEKGEEALKQMLQWGEGRFTVQPEAKAGERSIDSSIMHLLLTQAVEEDHAAAGVFGAVTDSG